MKKLTTICAALLFCIGASAYDPKPGDELAALFNFSSSIPVEAEKVTREVRTAFQGKFAAATEVNWKQNGEFFFATFLMDNKAFTVAYIEDGNFVAISRMLTLQQLPIAAAEALKNRFEGYGIPVRVTEISMEGSTNYYLKVEGKTRVLLVKCNPDGYIDVLAKTKKRVLVGKVY